LQKSSSFQTPPGVFSVFGAAADDGDVNTPPHLRPPDRPSAVMVLAPVLGLMIWIGLLILVF